MRESDRGGIGREGGSVAWALLAVAIGFELVGTLALRSVASSVTWWAVLLIVVAYGVSFTSMGFALRQLNVGVVYAIWSAVGIAAVSIAGALFFSESLNRQAIIGMLVIFVGLVVLVTSGSVRHD